MESKSRKDRQVDADWVQIEQKQIFSHQLSNKVHHPLFTLTTIVTPCVFVSSFLSYVLELIASDLSEVAFPEEMGL